MVDLATIPIELSFGRFRICITYVAESADVRPPETGDIYAQMGGPWIPPSREPVDNPQPTAYDRCDDRSEETFR